MPRTCGASGSSAISCESWATRGRAPGCPDVGGSRAGPDREPTQSQEGHMPPSPSSLPLPRSCAPQTPTAQSHLREGLAPRTEVPILGPSSSLRLASLGPWSERAGIRLVLCNLPCMCFGVCREARVSLGAHLLCVSPHLRGPHPILMAAVTPPLPASSLGSVYGLV